MASHTNPNRQETSNQKLHNQPEGSVEPENLASAEHAVTPLEDGYIKLIHFLSELSEKMDTTENQLEICLDALVAVRRFLDTHPLVAQEGITRPLGMLASAIHDLTQGSPPELLKPNQNIKGRPKSVSRTVTLQAVGAACAEILIWCGLSVESACKYVLKALEKEKQVNATGSKPVTWQTIKRWRDEMGGKNSSKSVEIYRDIQTGLKKALGIDRSIKQAEAAVKSCISGLESTGATGPRPKRKSI